MSKEKMVALLNYYTGIFLNCLRKTTKCPI